MRASKKRMNVVAVAGRRMNGRQKSCGFAHPMDGGGQRERERDDDNSVPEVSLNDEYGDAKSDQFVRFAWDVLGELHSESASSVRTEDVSSRMKPSYVSKGIAHSGGRTNPRRTLWRLKTSLAKGDSESATSSEQRGVVHLFALAALNISLLSGPTVAVIY